MTYKIEEAYLNGAVLTLLPSTVNQSFKDDALDCGLYVQLAASKQIDRFTHFQDWQAILIKALTAFGWIRLDFANQQQPISESIVVANLMRESLSESSTAWWNSSWIRFLQPCCRGFALKRRRHWSKTAFRSLAVATCLRSSCSLRYCCRRNRWHCCVWRLKHEKPLGPTRSLSAWQRTR